MDSMKYDLDKKDLYWIVRQQPTTTSTVAADYTIINLITFVSSKSIKTPYKKI